MGKANQQYLKAIRTGDDAGLRSIYLDFFPRITSLITRNGGTPDDAQDVFQDALVVLFEKCRDKNFVLSSAFLPCFMAFAATFGEIGYKNDPAQR